MKIKTATFKLEHKKGMPKFSNLTASMEITVEVPKGEKLKENECWDYLKKNIVGQTLDTSWIQTKEYKKHFTTTIKTKKTPREVIVDHEAEEKSGYRY